MYELEPGCRAALNARPVAPAPVGEGLSHERRAENEGAPSGDKRLAKRLVYSARVHAPRSPFSAAAAGMAAVTGFYRLPSARRAGAVMPEDILAPHK